MKKCLLAVAILGAFVFFFFFIKKKESGGSVNVEYLQACREVVASDDAFCQFKRHPLYALFQEFTTFEEGKELVEAIYREAPDLLNPILMKKFHTNDEVGDPPTFFYKRMGLFSPTTLRYIKVVGDLRAHFGNLDGMKVVEIGSGYGGQCKMLSDLFAFASYTLVDMPDALEVAKRYLAKLEVAPVQFIAAEQAAKLPCDLVVSHYGFTELSAGRQREYIDKILRVADRGYLICHFFPKTFGVRALCKRDLLKALAKAGISYQIEDDTQNRCTIIWRK
jgi:hypothetical protein